MQLNKRDEKNELVLFILYVRRKFMADTRLWRRIGR